VTLKVWVTPKDSTSMEATLRTRVIQSHLSVGKRAKAEEVEMVIMMTKTNTITSMVIPTTSMEEFIQESVKRSDNMVTLILVITNVK
jgi:hypothetical protein